MKAFVALIHREFIEHRGAFFIGPLILVAVMLGATILAFTVGRIDVRFSGALLTIAPLRFYEFGFLGFGVAWSLYLLAVLFFYCADGFAADKRNNSMLFWKSMPVSDFRMLLSKLVAAVTILPGTVYVIALLSGLLLFGVAYITMLINGTASISALGSIALIYGHVAVAILVTIVVGLLWYLPYMGLVGALATAMGRWAIPLSLLLPAIISTLEWVTLGGLHPFATRTSDYLGYRSTFPLKEEGYPDFFLASGDRFDAGAFTLDLVGRTDWMQVLIGAVFAVLVLYIASEYRRRAAAN
jgi:ABC-2 type transport system permease protein